MNDIGRPVPPHGSGPAMANFSPALEVAEQAAAANAVAPRVRLADIEQAIKYRYNLTGLEAAAAACRMPAREETFDEPDPLRVLSICLLVMRNGFTVIGKSAPASAENFNAELGRQLAYEDAVRQLWPLMGYALRDKLAGL